MSASVPAGSPGPEPALAAADLRVDEAGIPACDGLSFRTQGEHVLVLGAPRALFRAVIGLATAVRGTLSVRGIAASEATRRGVVAGVPSALVAPPRWTVVEYVTWSAKLAGVPAEAIRVSVDSALERLALGPMAKTEIVRLAPAAGRATGVASALATGADVIAIEDPLTGLADEAADAWGRVLAAALADHISLIFAPRMALASALARAADEAIVATASRIDGQGSPVELASAPRRFVARFDGPVASIAQVLAERGARVETRDHPLSHHLSIDLGTELSTHELIDICDRAGLAVVELVPAFRALT